MRANCHRSTNPAFIAVEQATRQELAQARQACRTCPLVASCATEALHAGTSLDGNTVAPAHGVLQAGVVCEGDADTAQALAQVAGVPVPTEYRRKRPRDMAPQSCRHCDRPMWKWKRGEVPDGYVKHYARGWCERCRSHYGRAMKSAAFAA